jgi:hypothetical protein
MTTTESEDDPSGSGSSETGAAFAATPAVSDIATVTSAAEIRDMT